MEGVASDRGKNERSKGWVVGKSTLCYCQNVVQGADEQFVLVFADLPVM